MKSGLSIDDQETDLLQRARCGCVQSRDKLLCLHQPRLLRMVEFRMSPLLARRVDPSDVVQDALIVAASRLTEFLANESMSFFVWLRWITRDRLTDLHREHLGAQKRDAQREVHIDSAIPAASSLQLADALVGHLTSPSRVAAREELRLVIQSGLAQLDPEEREILVLRHYEQLSLEEAAQCLQMSKSGANKRHLKALRELRKLLQPVL